MQIKERDVIINIVCRCRDCDNCPFKRDCGKRFLDVTEEQVVSAARNLFYTKDGALMRSLKFVRGEARYNIFMKYVSGVKYD